MILETTFKKLKTLELSIHIFSRSLLHRVLVPLGKDADSPQTPLPGLDLPHEFFSWVC